MLIDIHAHDGAFPHSEPVPGVTAAYDYRGETMDEFIADLERDQVSACFISSAKALLEDMIEGNVVTFRDASLDLGGVPPARLLRDRLEVRRRRSPGRPWSHSEPTTTRCWSGRRRSPLARRRCNRQGPDHPPHCPDTSGSHSGPTRGRYRDGRSQFRWSRPH